PSVPGGVDAGKDALLRARSSGRGVRSVAGGRRRAHDAAVGAAARGHDRRADAAAPRRDLRHPLRGYVSFTIMLRRSAAFLRLLGLGPPPRLAAQTAPRHARLEGKWQAKAEDEIRNIMVRSDSSAQFGDQVARWRVVGDSLWITLGDGVWQVYGMKLDGDKLKLAGGDLEKPVTLRRGVSADGRRLYCDYNAPPHRTRRSS